MAIQYKPEISTPALRRIVDSLVDVKPRVVKASQIERRRKSANAKAAASIERAVLDPLIALVKANGRPASGKVVVSLRLDPDVVEKFKATGKGWQGRINDILRAAKV